MQNCWKFASDSWIRLTALSGSDRTLLLETALLLSAVRLGLWLLPFQTLRQLLFRFFPVPIKDLEAESEPIRRLVWAVEVVSWRMPGGVKCLARALTTQALLYQRGYACELRIGVAKSLSGALEAHAWVEYKGGIIIGGMRDLAKFQPFPSIETKL